MEKSQSNFERIISYSGNGTIEINLSNFIANFQFTITAIKPAQALIDVYGPFGFDIGKVYLNGDSIFIYNSIQNQLIITDFSFEKLKRLNFINVDRKIIYAVLFGYLDQDYITADSSYIQNKEKQIELVKFIDKTKFEFIYDRSSSSLSKIRIFKSIDNPVFEIHFSDLVNSGEISFPKKIDFINLNTNEKISLNFKQLNFNELNEEINFELPEDAGIIRW
ncbi:MAG: DUF4292 domain-containing protein [Ignavibacteria bacterium]